MKNTINPKIVTLASLISIAASLLTVGCGHTLSKTQETHVSRDGTVRTSEKTVTENPDGSISRSETKKTDRP
jgi:hypothetical protein